MFFAPPELRPAESIKVPTSGAFRGLPRQLDEHSNPEMEMLTVKRRCLVTKLLLVVTDFQFLAMGWRLDGMGEGQLGG
jgi:hypothetical protein